jgi:ATP-dependent Zn protease
MISTGRRLVAVVAVVLLGVLGWMASGKGRPQIKATYSRFLQQVRTGEVASVIITASNSGASEATYRLKDGAMARTVLPSDYRDALATMQESLVEIEIQTRQFPLFMNALPFLLLLAVWVFLMCWKRNGARPFQL